MPETANQLKRIQDKLQLLLKQHASIQKENARLKEQLEIYNRQNSAQQETLDNLRQQVDVLKLHTGDMTEADRKELEKRINTYLKEIDRCIALLGE
jgi:chromosome segregation ATPase